MRVVSVMADVTPTIEPLLGTEIVGRSAAYLIGAIENIINHAARICHACISPRVGLV